MYPLKFRFRCPSMNFRCWRVDHALERVSLFGRDLKVATEKKKYYNRKKLQYDSKELNRDAGRSYTNFLPVSLCGHNRFWVERVL